MVATAGDKRSAAAEQQSATLVEYTDEQQQAFDKIKAWVGGGADATVPAVSDYQQIKIAGVTDANSDRVNASVEGKGSDAAELNAGMIREWMNMALRPQSAPASITVNALDGAVKLIWQGVADADAY